MPYWLTHCVSGKRKPIKEVKVNFTAMGRSPILPLEDHAEMGLKLDFEFYNVDLLHFTLNFLERRNWVEKLIWMGEGDRVLWNTRGVVSDCCCITAVIIILRSTDGNYIHSPRNKLGHPSTFFFFPGLNTHRHTYEIKMLFRGSWAGAASCFWKPAKNRTQTCRCWSP